MKMTSKKIFIILLVGAFLFPAFILAQKENQGGVEQKIKNFCSQFSGFTSKIDQRILSIEDKLTAKRLEITNRFQERRENREIKLDEIRAKWDANREEHYVELEKRAQTEAQKQAVVDFKKAVNDAVTARRLAIDTAIEDFKTGTDQAMASRKDSIDKLKIDYQNAVKAAIAKAQTDCATGLVPATVRQTLTNDLKAAKDKFNSEKQAIDKLQATKDQLIATKKAAFEKAISDFKAAMEKAKSDFKAAFSAPESTIED